MARIKNPTTVQGIMKQGKSISQLRREYSREAERARKRLAAISEKYPGSEPERMHAEDFKTLKSLGKLSEKELARELSRTRKFLHSESSKLKGYEKVRKDIIEDFHNKGYTFVNNENLDKVQAFLDEAQARGLDTKAGYASEELLEAFEAAEEVSADFDPNDILDGLIEDFTEW